MSDPTRVPQPTPEEERDAVLAERLDWEAEQEAAAPVALPRPEYDRLRAIEEAAREVMAEWDALGPAGTMSTVGVFRALRAALEGATHDPE